MSDKMYLGGWRSGYSDALDELYKVVEDDPDLDKRRLVLDLIDAVRARRDAAQADYEARLAAAPIEVRPELLPPAKGYRCPACTHYFSPHREAGCDQEVNGTVCPCEVPFGRVPPGDPPPSYS